MKYTKPTFIFPILVACFLILECYIAIILHYEFMRSDVLDYASMGWKIVFHEHPPLYALTIALVRILTLNLIPSIILMMVVNLAAFSACVLTLMEISRVAGVRQEWAALAALLFGLWPFVGLTYTVIPLADIPSICLTLAGIVFLQKSRLTQAGWMFGLAIITHKGVWPVIGLMALADFYTRREFFSKRNVLFIIATLLPLTVLWIAGIVYYHSASWLIKGSVMINTSMESKYLVLNGLLGTYAEGGIKGFIKGTIVLFLLGLSIFTLFASLKLKFKYYQMSAAISTAILAMFLFSSAHTIWGPVRFSRILALPLIFAINSYMRDRLPTRGMTAAIIILLLGLLLTQFAYAWYIVNIFYG